MQTMSQAIHLIDDWGWLRLRHNKLLSAREQLTAIFKRNRRLAELNPELAAMALVGRDLSGSHQSRQGRGKQPERLVAAENQPSKPRKYRNNPVEHQGMRFDSQKEFQRYLDLVVLERAGEIRNLFVHPKYEFWHNGIKIGSYKPDFTYTENGTLVVEDVKSEATKKERSYRRTKLMMKAFHGIEIKEI